jgi:hypothetical protein
VKKKKNKRCQLTNKGLFAFEKKKILLKTYYERVLELWVSLDCAGQLSRLPLHSTLLTLSYSSKINSYLYHQRVSPLLKIMP